MPRVKLVTSRGDIVVELFENEAPNTVANFISLVEQGFYDGTRFHRVLPNFMAQAGCPNSKDNDPLNDGQGDAGYSIADEMPEKTFRRHFRGSLSMANAGPDTNGSQFFITHRSTPWLDGKHTVFGRVVEGLAVVDRLQVADMLTSAEVLRKRDHSYEPEKIEEERK
ncbi:MAG: peptidylprolyl isomerase [Planctomycetota bacterium]